MQLQKNTGLSVYYLESMNIFHIQIVKIRLDRFLKITFHRRVDLKALVRF